MMMFLLEAISENSPEDFKKLKREFPFVRKEEKRMIRIFESGWRKFRRISKEVSN